MSLILMFTILAHQKATGMTLMLKHYFHLPHIYYSLLSQTVNFPFIPVTCSDVMQTLTAFIEASLHTKEALLNTSDSNP